jgi:hypothetical protein
MTDVRLAVAGSITRALRVGVSYHVISGNNVLLTRTDYSASDILDANIRTTFGYSGSAWSVGAVVLPTGTLSLGASARFGGDLRLSRGETRLANASVPDRYGASLSYTGFRDALVAVRFEKVAWSQIDALGGDRTDARDTQEIGVGAELPGPQIVGTPSLVRLGARWRDLPFAAGGAIVSEGTYGMGLGLSIAGGRALLDFGIGRAFRSNNSAYRESAWTLTTGILVRP